MASAVAALGSNQQPVVIYRARIDRQVRELALEHAAGARITVARPEIVGVRLTAAAYAHGLALPLPEKVVMARPTGFERADAISIRIPIEGAVEWLTSSETA